MKKVLIISYNFFQKDIIAPIRMQGLYNYLPEYNWNPYILTINCNNSIVNERIFQTKYVDIMTFLKILFNTDNYLEMRKKIDANLSNVYLKKNATSIINIIRDCVCFPDDSIGWVIFGIRRGKIILENDQFDAIISTYGPCSSHIIAHYLAKHYNIPWIADYRDLWTFNHNKSDSFIKALFEQKFEQKILSNSSLIITVSNHLSQKIFKIHNNKKIITIHNGFDPKLYRTKLYNNPFFRIIYSGTVYPNKQDPEPIFLAIKELYDENLIKRNSIFVEFYGDSNNCINDIIEEKYSNCNIKILNKVPREEIIEIQRSAQILLFLAWNDPDEPGIYTGKIFEYLAARRPILSVGTTDGGVIKNLLEQTHAGIHLNSKDDIKKFIVHSYNEFQLKGAVNYYGIKDEICKYSHKEMACKYANVLDEIIRQ